MKALIEHMMTLPGGQSCHNHVFIVSSRYSAHPVLERIMQVCTYSALVYSLWNYSTYKTTVHAGMLKVALCTL